MNAQTVLVVDDDPGMRKLLTLVLTLEHYRVLTACDGREALLVARMERPGVILLDLALPRMSGEEFRIAQLEDPAIRDIPVIVISGEHDAESTARDLGARGCIRKPLPLDDLTRSVAAQFTAPAAPLSSQRKAG